MALIVEDGSNVPNANSYADVAFIRAYAEQRRLPLPDNDADVEAFAINAMDAIESRSYGGRRTYNPQLLAFPRSGLETEEGEYAPNAIPSRVKKAQAQLVAYRAAGIDLFPSGNAEPAIKVDKVGPLTTEYFDTGGSIGGPAIPLADALLGPLERGQGAFTLSTVRV